MSQAILSGLAMGSGYVLMSLGFALELEIADIVNAAHGAFVVGGMYAVLKLTDAGVPIVPAVLLATLVVGSLSYPIYVLLIAPARAQAGHRVQLIYTLLLLSGLAVVYQLAFGSDTQAIHADFGAVSLLGGAISTMQVASIVVAVVVAVGLFLISRHTAIGKVAYVAGLYQQGARSLGAPIGRIYSMIFVLAGALGGLAGGLIVTFQPVTPSLGLEYIIVVFLVAIVARTHLLGCLILGLGYGVAQALLNYYVSSSVAGALTYVVFLVALVTQRQMLSAGHVLTRLATRRTPAGDEGMEAGRA